MKHEWLDVPNWNTQNKFIFTWDELFLPHHLKLSNNNSRIDQNYFFIMMLIFIWSAINWLFSIPIVIFSGDYSSAQLKDYKRVCYYTNWSQYRTGLGKFTPKNVDPFLCTHVVFAFAKTSGNRIEAAEWNDESTEWSRGT